MSDGQVVPIHAQDQRLTDEIEAAIRIVQGVHDGDVDAETELVQRYSRGLRYLLMRKIGDAELVRDLMQETFVIALAKLREEQLERPARLAGYLRGIAVRVAMNAGRRRSKDPLPLKEEALAAIPADERRQFEMVSAAETKTAVHELLDTMSVPRDRELLLRYYVYEQEKPEICRALGLDSLHFNRVLHRAKGRFRKMLEASGDASDLVAD